MTLTEDVRPLNITVPTRIVVALDAAVAPRSKSKFITQAIEEKLERMRWETAFARLAALPPTLTHITDAVQWVEHLRQEDDIRLEELS